MLLKKLSQFFSNKYIQKYINKKRVTYRTSDSNYLTATHLNWKAYRCTIKSSTDATKQNKKIELLKEIQVKNELKRLFSMKLQKCEN